jgi:hypothetical protein
MLLSGHKKHQWEVGLSLPNLILVTMCHSRAAAANFLVLLIVPKARSNAFIAPAVYHSPVLMKPMTRPCRVIDSERCG